MPRRDEPRSRPVKPDASPRGPSASASPPTTNSTTRASGPSNLAIDPQSEAVPAKGQLSADLECSQRRWLPRGDWLSGLSHREPPPPQLPHQGHLKRKQLLFSGPFSGQVTRSLRDRGPVNYMALVTVGRSPSPVRRSTEYRLLTGNRSPNSSSYLRSDVLEQPKLTGDIALHPQFLRPPLTREVGP